MNRNRTMEGMTLIELVVVLALLGGLASIAVRTASTMDRRGRYDQTAAQMKAVRDVVAGDGRGVGRFVRDMGRLPADLCELWEKPEDEDDCFKGHLIETNSASATLYFGWNGPYVYVGDTTETNLYDGFGNAFTNYTEDGKWMVKSFGADGVSGAASSWADRDQLLALSIPSAALTVNIKIRDLAAKDWLPAGTNTPVSISGSTTNYLSSAGFGVRLFTLDSVDGMVLADTVTSSCSQTGLVPTVCGVYACAKDTTDNWFTSGSDIEIVELNPGSNVVTLYLQERN